MDKGCGNKNAVNEIITWKDRSFDGRERLCYYENL